MNRPIYTIKDLDYKSGKEIILKIKNFEIHRGACYLFTGEMGSGKSLFINFLTKNNIRYNGEIIYDENNLRNISKRKYYQDIATVYQQTSRPFFKSVQQYITSYISKRNSRDKTKKYINSIVKTMSLNSILNSRVRSLTPSQFRWVDLAAKVGSNPKVLFIDEIEQHLSRESISILSHLLYKKCTYDGVTLICTSQYSDLLKKIPSVIITLKHGRISRLRSHSKRK